MGDTEEGGQRDSGGGKKDFCWTECDHLYVAWDEQYVKVFRHRVSVDMDLSGDIGDRHTFRIIF